MAEEALSDAEVQILLRMQRAGRLPADIAPPRSLATTGPPTVARRPTDPRPWGQWAIEEGLPVAGGVLGGTVGTVAGGPVGGVGGGALGAMAGRAVAPEVAEYVGYAPSAPITGTRGGDIALEGALGLVGEGVARTVVPGAQALYRRGVLGTTNLRPAATATQRIAALDAVGAEPTLADVLGPGANAARREQALSLTPGGASTIQAAREQRAAALTGTAETLLERLGPATTAIERGTATADAIQRTVDTMKGVESKLWTALEQHVGPSTPLANANLKLTAHGLLNRELQRDAPQQDRHFIATLQSIINGPDQVPFGAFQARRSGYLEEAGKPLLVRDRHAAGYSTLAAAALEDIGTGVRQVDPTHGTLYDRARALTARKHQLIERLDINALTRMDPEQVARLTEGRLTESALTRLREALLGTTAGGASARGTTGGAEAWNNIRRAVVEKELFGPQGAQIMVGGTEAKTVSPERLQKGLARIPGLTVLLDPTERAALDTVERAAEVMAHSARPGLPIGSQTAQAQAFGARGGHVARVLGAGLAGMASQALGGDPITTGLVGMAGATAAPAVLAMRQHAAARLLTSPTVARQLASPAAKRWAEQFARTGVMPRALARILGQAAAGSATTADGRGRP